MHAIGSLTNSMKKSLIIRLFALPLGLLFKAWHLANEGARDIHNKLRYRNSEIDSECCINENTLIEANVHILKNCYINNCKIGSYSYIGRNSIVQNTKVGRYCSIANDVFIGLGKHPTDLISTSPIFYRKRNTLRIQLVENDSDFKEYADINIGNDVWIGTRAIVMDGVRIGNGAIIAANSVITKDVPPYAIVAGIPAKILKYRFAENKIEKLQSLNWWDWPISENQRQNKRA